MAVWSPMAAREATYRAVRNRQAPEQVVTVSDEALFMPGTEMGRRSCDRVRCNDKFFVGRHRTHLDSGRCSCPDAGVDPETLQPRANIPADPRPARVYAALKINIPIPFIAVAITAICSATLAQN
jgi:hypothetical protein